MLVERGELGSGSTSKGAGGVRALFSDELNVRARAALARGLGAHSASGLAGRSTCRQVGYLFLLRPRRAT